MAPLPLNRPQQLSLGPLEREILAILWTQKAATVKEIHDAILADPDRDLTQASVTTVLQRLAKKGWVKRRAERQSLSGKPRRVYVWEPKVSRQGSRCANGSSAAARLFGGRHSRSGGGLC